LLRPAALIMPFYEPRHQTPATSRGGEVAGVSCDLLIHDASAHGQRFDATRVPVNTRTALLACEMLSSGSEGGEFVAQRTPSTRWVEANSPPRRERVFDLRCQLGSGFAPAAARSG
jgi:hypothetical protein